MSDVRNGTLVAATVKTETLDGDYDNVDVLCIGSAAIYFTTDGTAPTVGGDGCYVAAPNGSLRVPVEGGGDTVVKMISASTPDYSVSPDPGLERSGAGLATTSVAGAVEIANDVGNPVPVNGTVTVSDGSGPVTVDGTVEITNDVGNPIPATLQPGTSGGSSPWKNLDVDEDAADQIVKAAAGQLYGYYLYNNAATVRFVKVYDKATAPTQADTPVWTIPIPAGSGANVAFPNGVAFANGISLRATTGVADNDVGAPAANDVIVNLAYK